MAPTTDHPFRFGNDAPVTAESTITDLAVQGTLPAALSGRFLHIGPKPIGNRPDAGWPYNADAMVHGVKLRSGRAVSCWNRWVLTDATAKRLGTGPVPGPRPTGPDTATTNVFAFGGSVLALGDGSLAYELTADLDTSRRVDLAGGSRGLGPHPKLDPSTGELHLLALSASGAQAHVVIPSAALTRTSRLIDDPPGRIRDLAVSGEHVVVVTDGFIGVMPRTGEPQVTWMATDRPAPRLVHAGDDHDTVVVHPDARHDTELVVLDAADLTRSPVASVRIPRRIPHGLHAAWIPSNR